MMVAVYRKGSLLCKFNLSDGRACHSRSNIKRLQLSTADIKTTLPLPIQDDPVPAQSAHSIRVRLISLRESMS